MGNFMETSVFLKKLIFGLTTGSILFYLVSFHSVGKTRQENLDRKACQTELIKVRSGRPVALKYQYEVVPGNVLSLSELEQRMLTQYMKKTNHSLIVDGVDNPFLITSYRMEGPSRNLLGYKIVVDTLTEDKDVMTFYLSKKQKLLFWYVDSEIPQQKWNCDI
jgi:hypothetical protein